MLLKPPFLDFDLSITNDIVLSKIYDKGDDFNFEILMKMFLAPLSMVLTRFVRVCANVGNFNNRNQLLTSKLLYQGYQYNKLCKAFSKFYHRHSELIVKYNVGLKTLLQKGKSELVCHFPIGILGQMWYLIVSIPDLCTLTYFDGDLVYKFKGIVGKPNFIDQ